MVNILIAEDEENLLNLYKIRLDKRGYNVILANNGKQAIDIIYKGGVDLAILDVMLPIYSGFEVRYGLKTTISINRHRRKVWC